MTPVPASGVRVGPLARQWLFTGPTAARDFGEWSHSWFNGSEQNGVPTSAGCARLVRAGVALELRGGVGASINTNPKDAARPGFQFAAGYLEWDVLFSTIEGSQPTINYHSAQGASNGTPVPGQHLGRFIKVGVHRTTTRVDVYFDATHERGFAIQDGAAPHYLVANVGARGWSAVWDTGQHWPTTGEDDDAEDYGPGPGAPDGVYLTVRAVRAWR